MLTPLLLPPNLLKNERQESTYTWGHKNVPKVLSPLEDIGVTKEFLDLELMSAMFTLECSAAISTMCALPLFNFLILKIRRKIFTQRRYVYVKQVSLCKEPEMQYLLDKLLLLLPPQHPSHPKQEHWRYSLIPRWDSWIQKWSSSWPLENKLGS